MGRLARIAALLAGLALPALADPPSGEWLLLEPGLELGEFEASGDLITVLRIDPELWDLRLLSAASIEGGNRSLRAWCEEFELVAAVNAGMFATDYLTHIGFMGCGDEINNGRVNAYRSVAAFDALQPDIPRFRIFDLDETDFEEIRGSYRCHVQNLRLVKRPGENRWPQQEKRWSEVALGEDGEGRVLFIHSRAAHSMHDLTRLLLSLPLGLVAAQHLEGGPEAQLFLSHGELRRELVGSFETSFFESGSNWAGWPVPNVLGVVRREP